MPSPNVPKAKCKQTFLHTPEILSVTPSMGSHVIHTLDDRFHIRMRRHVAEQVVLLRCGEESTARQMQVAFGELVLYFLACCIGSTLLTDVFRPFAPRRKSIFGSMP